MKEFIIKIDGMMCGMCESHVNDAIRNIANVKKVTSSHKNGETVIVADDDFDLDKATSSITALGYKVGEITEKPYKKQGFFSNLFKKN